MSNRIETEGLCARAKSIARTAEAIAEEAAKGLDSTVLYRSILCPWAEDKIRSMLKMIETDLAYLREAMGGGEEELSPATANLLGVEQPKEEGDGEAEEK